jgi:hypothetical protein
MRTLWITILSICVASVASGQSLYERYFSISYDVNVPLVNTGYVKDVSTRGFQVGFRQKINEKFYAGLDLNDATYSSHIPRQTYSTDGGALTTDFYNYVYSYGGAIAAEYYFDNEKKIMPFVGIGIGATYNEYTQYYNLFSNSDKKWGMLLRPQAGAIFKLGKFESWGLITAIHLDYSTAKSKDFGYDNFMNVGFRVGLVFFDW